MTYNWISFNLQDALAGTLVGFMQTDAYDLSKTGNLTIDGVWSAPPYKVVIEGVTLRIDKDGKVVYSTPTSAYVGQTLQMVTTVMGSEASVGSSVTRSAGSSGEGHTATAVLSTMEPRDHFAMNVLNAMLHHMEIPEAKDDATMLMFSRAAYKWAQAMMIAAADSREGTSSTPGTQTSVNANDLQSNTEKVLYNINDSLKSIKTQLDTSLGDINDSVEAVWEVTEAEDSITIMATIFKTKFLRMEFSSDMAYSDVSVFFNLAVKEGGTATTRKVGFVIPRGTVTVIESLDTDVTEITAITSAVVRGQGHNDPNTYVISTTP